MFLLSLGPIGFLCFLKKKSQTLIANSNLHWRSPNRDKCSHVASTVWTSPCLLHWFIYIKVLSPEILFSYIYGPLGTSGATCIMQHGVTNLHVVQVEVMQLWTYQTLYQTLQITLYSSWNYYSLFANMIFFPPLLHIVFLISRSFNNNTEKCHFCPFVSSEKKTAHHSSF